MVYSIRSRLVFTMGTNLFRSAVGFSTGMLLARFLGPDEYGRFAFLVATFVAIRVPMDMGSSMAFFTFLSQKPRTRRFVGSYFAWLALQLLIAIGVIGLLFPTQWIAAIWHGEQRGLVLLAFTATFMQFSIWPTVQQAGESQRGTFWAQGVGVGVSCTHLVAVILLWNIGLLGLYAIFAAIAIEYLVAAVILQKHYVYASVEADEQVIREPLFRKYLDYCLPLVPVSLFGFAYNFIDPWLMQRYGGSVKQAYYSVAAQIAAVALIATTSVVQIFWKEIAEAHHRKDHERTFKLYRKISRLLFFVGAVMAGFLMPWSEYLLNLILGASYVGGAVTLAIMCLYPVHQSMGQIGATMLYATERGSLINVYGIAVQTVSMLATYFVLAPRDAVVPGLGLGSEGLALKMVLINLISANGVAYIIARVLKWPFDWVYQPVSLLGCLGLGWVTESLMTLWVVPDSHWLVAAGLGSVSYLLLIAGFVYALPWLIGLTRDELIVDLGRAWRGTQRAVGF